MKNYILIFSLITATSFSYGQGSIKDTLSSNYNVNIGAAAGITSGNAVPFWMRSGRYGSTPINGLSASFFGNIAKNYDQNRHGLLDWGFSFDGIINTGKTTEFQLIEGYIKGKIKNFQIKLGRSRDIHGLVDSVLSSGSFSTSGNALGIPKVELSLTEYQSIPFTRSIFAFKGNLSYGLMGKIPIQYGDNKGTNVRSYYHHLSAYGRLGKPEWRLKFYLGLNHDVIWGSDALIFGDQYDLSTVDALFYVLTGKKYQGAKDISKIGNHLGSIDIAAEYNYPNIKFNIYHQFFYDKGALGYLANIKDGLTGISLTNNKYKKEGSGWEKVLFEVLYSKDQAGQEGAKFTPSGPEYYYNHAVYPNGFSYKGLGIGNPLFTPSKFAKDGQASNPTNYFINNRIVAFHVGLMGSVKNWDIILKSTYSRNFGDFRTSGPTEQWFNGKRVRQNFNYGIFEPVNQFSGYLEMARTLENGYILGLVMANDYGKLLNQSVGGFVKISKKL